MLHRSAGNRATSSAIAVQRAALTTPEGNAVSEVPVEDPGSFHLLVRRSVAETLGFSIPDELLAQADEVVDR